MADGEVLFGKPGLPIYGKNGTILYRTQITMSCSIVISWTGGNDVDICAFYSHNATQSIGYEHAGSINLGDGFTATWGGDNTSGGPETVNLAYSGSQGLGDKSFEIHANWYSVGTDSEGNEQSGGGPATVTATDAKGNAKTYTIMPATSKRRAAQSGDPGVRINFKNDGTIKEIVAA